MEEVLGLIATFEGDTSWGSSRERQVTKYDCECMLEDMNGFKEGTPPRTRPADNRELSPDEQVEEFERVSEIYAARASRWIRFDEPRRPADDRLLKDMDVKD
jgi:hypothetical protein